MNCFRLIFCVLIHLVFSTASADFDEWYTKHTIPVQVDFAQSNHKPDYDYRAHQGYNPYAHHISKPNLHEYSAQQLVDYFACNRFTEEEILGQRTLYMSDEFVKIAKQCAGYKAAISKLHRKYRDMSAISKGLRWLDGKYCSGLTKRIRMLYKEMKCNQQTQPVSMHATTQYSEQKQQHHEASNRQHSPSPEACNFARQYDIDTEKLSCARGSPAEQQLHAEFGEMLHTTALLARNVAPGENLFIDTVGYAADIGLTAHQAGNMSYARCWADVGWIALDCVQAVGEGVLLGTKNTLHTFVHPLQTAKNLLASVATLTGALVQAVGIAGECAYLCATDTQQYCIRRDEIVAQLKAIAAHTQQKIRSMPPREIVRQGTAFITEGVLLHKAFTIVHELSCRMIPVAQQAIECLAREESIACFTGGEKVVARGGIQEFSNTARGITQNTTTLLEHVHANLLQSLEAEIAELHRAFDYARKGFGEFANKYVKIDYGHILGMELFFNDKNLQRLSGFHHDFMNTVEKSGALQFMNKVCSNAGFYGADLVVDGMRFPKKTFFPAHWSRETVISKIYEAYDNFIKHGAQAELLPSGKYKCIGEVLEGVKIEFYITKSGKIVTAYPLL
jgi:hypothetical protein